MYDARGLTYGLAIGAGLMFIFDPRQGGARRAVIRQKAHRAAHDVEAAVAIGARDLEHRAGGFFARLRGPAMDVSDDVLVNRVRAKLGRACSHPQAIDVVAKGEGCIELKGPILRSELDEVLHVVGNVRGVAAIDDDLEVHDEPGDVASLQGPSARRMRVLRTPATRLLVSLAAAAVGLRSLLRGHPVGLLAAGAVVVALARTTVRRGNPRPLAKNKEEELTGLREAYAPDSEWAPAPPM